MFIFSKLTIITFPGITPIRLKKPLKNPLFLAALVKNYDDFPCFFIALGKYRAKTAFFLRLAKQRAYQKGRGKPRHQAR